MSVRRQLSTRLTANLPEGALRAIARAQHNENPFGASGPRPAAPGAALVVDRFDAHQARRDTVQTVRAALEGAGVRYAIEPGPHGVPERLLVAPADRTRAATTLHTLPGRGWSASGRGGMLRVSRRVEAPNGALLAGPELGCDVAFADLPADAAAELPSAFELRVPVDLVYTWVDGTDPDWLARKAAFDKPRNGLHEQSASVARFVTRDELRYSLRSVAMFAPWVRRIHIVTDAQVPAWLDTGHPQITIVDHREIFTDPSVLPVFNSHAIESQLHHIPDLAEQYLYLNDDIFFGRLVEPELFFEGSGLAKFFLSTETIPPGPVSAADVPAIAAAKRMRDLLAHDFGVTVTQKFEHGAHPQRRSAMMEMEKYYPGEFERVTAARFRHPDDLSIASSLHHYFAYLTGYAVPGKMDYRYQDIGLPSTPRKLDAILRDRPQVFCLNDIDSSPEQFEAQRARLGEFFETYFPVPSPFER